MIKCLVRAVSTSFFTF